MLDIAIALLCHYFMILILVLHFLDPRNPKGKFCELVLCFQFLVEYLRDKQMILVAWKVISILMKSSKRLQRSQRFYVHLRKKSV
jgi:hypothetical protein